MHGVRNKQLHRIKGIVAKSQLMYFTISYFLKCKGNFYVILFVLIPDVIFEWKMYCI